MHVLVMTVELQLPTASLKGKRGIVKSVLARARNRYNVSASEVELQDHAGSAILAFSTVSSSAVRARQVLQSLEEWIVSERPDVEVISADIEQI
jgi:uncharacterized protein YlxP (DUF503 family)